LSADKLKNLKLQRGFMPLSETLSNQEYPHLWDVLFERHPKGPYYRGKFEQSGSLIPARSLLLDMFAEQKQPSSSTSFKPGTTDSTMNLGRRERSG